VNSTSPTSRRDRKVGTVKFTALTHRSVLRYGLRVVVSPVVVCGRNEQLHMQLAVVPATRWVGASH
jgi:hypothetical protein